VEAWADLKTACAGKLSPLSLEMQTVQSSLDAAAQDFVASSSAKLHSCVGRHAQSIKFDDDTMVHTWPNGRVGTSLPVDLSSTINEALKVVLQGRSGPVLQASVVRETLPSVMVLGVLHVVVSCKCCVARDDTQVHALAMALTELMHYCNVVTERFEIHVEKDIDAVQVPMVCAYMRARGALVHGRPSIANRECVVYDMQMCAVINDCGTILDYVESLELRFGCRLPAEDDEQGKLALCLHPRDLPVGVC
jgi:hypothetical protein